jgi:hypothetical protein
MLARVCLALLASTLLAAPAQAKEYAADRFDARIEVLPGGDLRVTETITFRFVDRTFRQVFRTIPTRSTDGVEFVSASMDGTPMAQGEEAGAVRVRRKNGLRVEWHFPPVSNSTHAFELVYVVRGVVKQAGRDELLEWRALPREHDYQIADSEVRITAPAMPSGEPRLETRRIQGDSRITVEGGTVVARASQIRRNGSLVVSIPFANGSVLDGPPNWQARQIAHREQSPTWLAAAGGVLLVGLVVLFGLRQNYDPPPPDLGIQWQSMLPPDSLPPALGGALAANGSPQLQHALAALFSLGEQGILAIREEPKGMFGQRNFIVERVQSGADASPHEAAVLEIVFGGDRSRGAGVPLGKARSSLLRRASMFKNAVLREMADAQLLDRGRQASRRRYTATGILLLILAGLAAAGCIPLLEAFGPWPLLVPLALAVVAIISVIVAASQTPLSNEGVRRAEQWRAFRKHLSDPQGIEPRWGAAGNAEARILPFAVALGLASAWSKFMKKRNGKTPAWFQAASGLDSGQSFATLVAVAGASAHGGGSGAGGGGAAGGGASGAS